jgi:hypothetical protein
MKAFMMRLVNPVFLALLLLLGTADAFATVHCNYYVDVTNGSDNSTGTSTGGAAFRSLQRAAYAVQPGDTVCVEPGIYQDVTVANNSHAATLGPQVLLITTPGTAAAPIAFVQDPTGPTGQVVIQLSTIDFAGIKLGEGCINPTQYTQNVNHYYGGYPAPCITSPSTTTRPAYIYIENFVIKGLNGTILNGAWKTGDQINPAPAQTTPCMPGVTHGDQNSTFTSPCSYSAIYHPELYPQYNGSGITVDGRVTDPTIVNAPVHHIYIKYNTVTDVAGGGITFQNADYVSTVGNFIQNACLFTAYGSSGISVLTPWNANLSTPDTNFDGHAGSYRVIVDQNQVIDTVEWVPWAPYQVGGVANISDGEGIIMDTFQDVGVYSTISHTTNAAKIAADFDGKTLISNNASYWNGSAAIELLNSRNIDVFYNSTFNDARQNVTNGNEGARGELSLQGDVKYVNVYNNIFMAKTGATNQPIVFITQVVAPQGYFNNNVIDNPANHSPISNAGFLVPGSGDTSKYVDPGYYGANTSNYTPVLLTLTGPTSPAYNTAITYAPVNVVTDSLSFVTRPATPDIGAYQH